MQGITTNLLDLAWKHYLHKLATTPAAYSAFLGDTAMWTGIVTGARIMRHGGAGAAGQLAGASTLDQAGAQGRARQLCAHASTSP